MPRFTPDGIPMTLENKFDDAIYNYLYAYWKEQSGEYDPKDDEIIMTKENSFTKNEKKFEQWLLQQYGMTKKEEREYTFKGNLLSLGEIGLSAWGIASAGATKLVVPGKFLASNADDTAKKALQQDTIEDAVEGTLKKEVAENTAKKEIADTAEDLSQKTIDKDDVLEDSSGMRRESESQNIGSTSWEAKMPRTGEEWSKYFQDTYGAENIKWMPRSFKHMIENPQTLYGLTQSETAKILGQGWTASSYGKSGTGWKFINDASPDLMVFYHNADGVHGGAYYGFSSGLTGTVKLVGNDYIPLTGDKATIIQMKY